jgi:transposase-like protein/IS1 family transposase
MTCRKCQHSNVRKFGKYGRQRIQRYRCSDCRATFSMPPAKPLGNHTLEFDKAVQIVRLLMEGVTIRGTSRITGVHKNTIMSLSVTVGRKCLELLDSRIRDIHPRYVQADEIHTFVHTKEKHLWRNHPAEWGDCWTWIALDAETKLIIAHHVGKRRTADAVTFVRDLASRTTGRFQLTTDAFKPYYYAVPRTFGNDLDYAQLAKVFSGTDGSGPGWYHPPEVVAVTAKPITGDPDADHISTSYVERSNLSMRTSLRRFTRLALGFSKKRENLAATVALYIAWYNYARLHQTLRCTPAMAAGLADHIWTLQELLGEMDS